jgi:hypothetical protein
MDMRFGTCNVGSVYRAGFLKRVAKEVSIYKLDLAAVQEVKWNRGDIEPIGEFIFSNLKRKENPELGTPCLGT